MSVGHAENTRKIAETKLARQKDLEDQAMVRGRHRFDKKLEEAREKGRESTHGASKKILVEGWPKLSRVFRVWLDDADSGRGRRHTAVEWMKRVGTDEVAAITLRVVLDRLHKPRQFRKVASGIADRILMEARSRRLEKEAPRLFAYRVQTFRNTAHYRHMRNSMQATIRYSNVDVDDLTMTQSQKLLVGTKCLDLLQQALGIIETSNERVDYGGSYRTAKIVQVDEETKDWLASRNAKLRDLWPRLGPMVVPPLKWGPGQLGGYRYALRGQYGLIRKDYLQNVETDHLDKVFDALNTVQETAWTINGFVLGVVQVVTRRGGDRAGIPKMEKIPLPPKPPNMDEDEEAKQEWKEAARRCHLQERERKSDAASFLKTLNVARQLQDEEELYWPHNVDFRGRVYPIPTTLQPQGPDLHRGLLRFAEGRKLGRSGSFWLAVHGANCIGEKDKAPYEDRVEWIEDHSEKIRRVAEDPFANTWWQDADEPWQTLAFCYEWNELLLHRESGGDDEDFVSYLPVYVDGSCNGLQHYAALLRDETGGEAVNLLPTDEPKDFYSRVLRATKDNLETIAVQGTEAEAICAGKWLSSGLVTRDIVKRPSMTFSYGSRQYGFSQQIEEYIRSNTDWWDTRDYFTETLGDEETELTYRAFQVLAQAIWGAIGEEAECARKAMDWIKDSASAVAKSENHLTWEVPYTHFQVYQRYSEPEIKQVKTVLSGSIIQPAYYEHTDKPEVRKQRSAAPPNLIHSLDAVNLIMAVNMASDDGVSHLSVIHDSFGTHAGDMETLHKTIRESFVELHRYPILEDLEAQFRTQVDNPDEVPEYPERGDLDLGQVLASPYFFS